MSASAMSKGFFEFVKSIGEAKSKQEEDRIIEGEMSHLKTRMSARNVGSRQMREYLIRMVYVEMLGHDASFGHIHAVKLTRARKLVDKRVGYMACTLCLHNEHELMLLLVGGMQTDLQSTNQLEVATALIVATKLINADTVPAVIPLVSELLTHSEANIRKKAVMAIHRFYTLSPESCTDVVEKGKRMLCDKDPSVMGAALHLLADLMEDDANRFKDLVSSFVSILKQIIEHRLPKDYDYHRMPAPWIQIRLLQTLGLLGQADKAASQNMYEVLHEVMRRADIGINVGYAIIYECVRTVTTIFPNPQLLGEAAKCTSRFITSENHNLKYLGINALASIVQVNPSAAHEHQMVVIDCLEDKDETLRRKTLDLLYRMTSEQNVNVICDKLTASLKDSVDVYLRTELVDKITELAERYAPDPIWYIETMTEVFELGGDLVRTQIAHAFVRGLASAVQENLEDDDAEEDVGAYAVAFFYEALDRKRIPNVLLKVCSWVLGEYGYLSEEHDVLTLIAKLWEKTESQGESSDTRAWAMAATSKLCVHLDVIPEQVISIVKKYQASVVSDLQQTAHELLELFKNKRVMASVFENSSIVDEVDVDEELSFLSEYVAAALANGADPYVPPDEFAPDVVLEEQKGIKFEHVVEEDSSMVNTAPLFDDPVPRRPGFTTHTTTSSSLNQYEEPATVSKTGIIKKTTVKNVWGPGGYNESTGGSTGAATATAAVASSPPVRPRELPRDSRASSIDRSVNKTDAPRKQVPQHQKTEKELLADELFGGGTTSKKGSKRSLGRKLKSRRNIKAKTKTSSAVSRPQAAAPVEQAASATQSPVRDEPDDLLDLSAFGGGGSSSAAPSQPVQHVTQSAAASDPLDLLSFGLEPASAAPAAPAVASGDPMEDLLFGAAAVPSGNGMGGDLLFGGLDMGGGSPPVVDSVPAAGYAGIDGSLRSRFDGFEHGRDEAVASDSNLQVNYLKVYKPQQTLTVLVLSCLSRSHPIQNVNVAVHCDNPGASLQVGFDMGNSSPKPALRNAFTASVASIASDMSAALGVTCNSTNVVVTTLPTNLTVTISYTSGDGSSRNLRAQIPVLLCDLVRPAPIQTQQFGATWPRLSNGAMQFVLNGSCTTTPDYVNRIKQLHFQHVQTIGQEIICAGQFVSPLHPEQVVPCLVHSKLQPAGLEVNIRTGFPNVSKSIAADLQKALA